MAAPSTSPVNNSDPAEYWATVTPSDGTDLSAIPRALYVGTAGDISVTGADGLAATFVGVPGGQILPVRARRVRATGTTASNILALY